MAANAVPPADEKTLQAQYDEFYEDVFEELSNFGEIEELNVCENLGDHLIGNVYVKFHTEEEASDALTKSQGRFYGGMCSNTLFSPLHISSILVYILPSLYICGINVCPFHSLGLC